MIHHDANSATMGFFVLTIASFSIHVCQRSRDYNAWAFYSMIAINASAMQARFAQVYLHLTPARHHKLSRASATWILRQSPVPSLYLIFANLLLSSPLAMALINNPPRDARLNGNGSTREVRTGPVLTQCCSLSPSGVYK